MLTNQNLLAVSMLTPTTLPPKVKLSRTILERGVKVNGKDYRYAQSTDKEFSNKAQQKRAEGYGKYGIDSTAHEDPQVETFDMTGSFGGLGPVTHSARVVSESVDNPKTRFVKMLVDSSKQATNLDQRI